MTKLPITIPTSSLRQRLAGLWLVVRIIWREAPLTIAVQAVGAVLSAVLPLARAGGDAAAHGVDRAHP